MSSASQQAFCPSTSLMKWLTTCPQTGLTKPFCQGKRWLTSCKSTRLSTHSRLLTRTSHGSATLRGVSPLCHMPVVRLNWLRLIRSRNARSRSAIKPQICWHLNFITKSAKMRLPVWQASCPLLNLHSLKTLWRRAMIPKLLFWVKAKTSTLVSLSTEAGQWAASVSRSRRKLSNFSYRVCLLDALSQSLASAHSLASQLESSRLSSHWMGTQASPTRKPYKTWDHSISNSRLSWFNCRSSASWISNAILTYFRNTLRIWNKLPTNYFKILASNSWLPVRRPCRAPQKKCGATMTRLWRRSRIKSQVLTRIWAALIFWLHYKEQWNSMCKVVKNVYFYWLMGKSKTLSQL